MAQTTILAAGTSAATSTDVPLAAGASATIGAFVASGAIPQDAILDVVVDSPGADVPVKRLTGGDWAVHVDGPCTVRVLRRTAGRSGTSVGAFSET